jgi:phosphate transport system substrate-binding protein
MQQCWVTPEHTAQRFATRTVNKQLNNMRTLIAIFIVVANIVAANGQGDAAPQADATKPLSSAKPSQKVVVVTGARFTYKLVQQWIDEFNKTNPDVQIVIEARGSTDPAKFDVLTEVYEHDPATKASRQYLNIGRYAILPVAVAKSEFAQTYTKKGLNTALIKQIFFHDIFADQEEQSRIKSPFTVYTRLQKAGVPIVFSSYFGFAQKDIKGKGIAGADEHLLKAIGRDSTGVSYLPLPLIYDQQNKKVLDGLAILPVDVDGNGKVSDDEKFYEDQAVVVEKLESLKPKDVKNIPIGYLHLSVDKKTASKEAIAFVKWVSENGQRFLHDHGYLQLEAGETPRFDPLASQSSN